MMGIFNREGGRDAGREPGRDPAARESSPRESTPRESSPRESFTTADLAAAQARDRRDEPAARERRDEAAARDEHAAMREHRDDATPQQPRDDAAALRAQRDAAATRERSDGDALQPGPQAAAPRHEAAAQPAVIPGQAEPKPAAIPGQAEPRPAARQGGEDLMALFTPEATQQFRARWDAVQIGFVDDPARAVRDADELVAQVLKSLAESFAGQRARIEGDGQAERASTEDHRMALRRYRSFFQRLLSL